MGKLYEVVQKIDQLIKSKNLDPFKTRGAIGLRAGVVLGMIDARTPDDIGKLTALKKAVKEVLNVAL